MRNLLIGDEVEWDTFRGTDRGRVSMITAKRVYVRNTRVRTRGKGAGTSYDCEFWWDAHEVDRLRKVEP